jgi:hypothetical protein
MMAELDEVGLITDQESAIWGSKRRYPTVAEFLEAVRNEFGLDERDANESLVTTKYMRKGGKTEDCDVTWYLCDGPARGATEVWQCS